MLDKANGNNENWPSLKIIIWDLFLPVGNTEICKEYVFLYDPLPGIIFGPSIFKVLLKSNILRKDGRYFQFGRTTSGCLVNGSVLRGKFHIREGGGGKYYLRWKQKKEIGNILRP